MCDKCEGVWEEYPDYKYCPYCGDPIELSRAVKRLCGSMDEFWEQHKLMQTQFEPIKIEPDMVNIMELDLDNVDVSKEMEMLKKEYLKPLANKLADLYINIHFKEEEDEH